MSQSGAIKGAFLAVWLLLVAAVIGALYNQDRFYAVERRPIAQLTEKSGIVTVRPGDQVSWQEIDVEQDFIDGDRVATGRGARSKIGFGSDRGISLGEDTQVQITEILQANQESAYMITLVRGTVLADVAESCISCPPLIIRAGAETYSVTSGKKVGLVKTVGQKVKKVDPKILIPLVRVVKAPVVAIAAPSQTPMPLAKASATPSMVPPSPSAVPVPSPSSAPRLEQARGFEAEINPTGAGASVSSPRAWWTLRPMSALGGMSLEFPITRPTKMPRIGRWRPLYQLSGSDGQSGKEVITGSGLQDDSLVIPIEKIRRAATVRKVGAATEYVFKLRGGALITGKEKGESRSISENAVEYRIRSFGDASGPVAIALSELSPDKGSSIWFSQKQELTLEAAPIAILLSNGADLKTFYPYMRGASGLGLRNGGLFSSQGIFVVRNQVVVAQLVGKGISEDVINKVMRLLGGDFVFKGARSALNDSRGKSQGDLVQWIGALLDKGNVLYILKRSKLYPVSRDFIKTNNEVAQFIDSQARAIFLEKVEILDYR